MIGFWCADVQIALLSDRVIRLPSKPPICVCSMRGRDCWIPETIVRKEEPVRLFVPPPPGTVTVRLFAPAPFAGMYRLVRRSSKIEHRGIAAGATRPEPVARYGIPYRRIGLAHRVRGSRRFWWGSYARRSISVCGKAGGILVFFLPGRSSAAPWVLPGSRLQYRYSLETLEGLCGVLREGRIIGAPDLAMTITETLKPGTS
jgi:hypothetical protein